MGSNYRFQNVDVSSFVNGTLWYSSMKINQSVIAFNSVKFQYSLNCAAVWCVVIVRYKKNENLVFVFWYKALYLFDCSSRCVFFS